MLRWFFWIVVLVAIVLGCLYAWETTQSERVCHFTNRCEDSLHSLETQLEFYSSDRVLEVEKASGKTDKRRAYYPVTLEELIKNQDGSREYATCPVYGVRYRYVALDGGKSFLAWCPARHRFHFAEQPFVNAVKPDQINMHLYVKGGKVSNIVGEHPNPFDFLHPLPKASAYRVEATKLSPNLIEMLAENPVPVSPW